MDQQPRAASRPAFALLLGASLASGLAGLCYEVLWSRALVPALGNSADSCAAVLVAFMGSLGLGALVAGRAGDRIREPLLLYAGLEAVIAASAFLVPAVARSILPGAAAALVPEGARALGWLARLGIACLVVSLPAAAMGGTLPVLVRSLSRRKGDPGRALAWLYLANTAGACAGAAAAGMWIVPALGVRTGSGIAACLNAGAALAALAARSRLKPATPVPAAAGPDGSPGRLRAPALAFASGALVLVLERLWSRLLVLVLGHDTYGFALMLVAALAGVAIGAAVAGAIAQSRASALAWAGALLLAGSASAVGMFALTASVVSSAGPDPFGLAASASLGTAPTGGLWGMLLVALMPALLPAAAAGAVLPLACAAADPAPGEAGRSTARITAANAAGCVVGALAPSLGLVEWLGVQGAVTAAAACAAAPAAIVLAAVRPARAARWTGAASLALLALLALLVPAGSVRSVTLAMVGGPVQEIVFHAEGRTGTVTVTRDRIDGVRQLFVNAVGEVTTRYVHDQSFSLLGHLGPLLHPDPRRALVICYGAGLTTGAVATHDGIDVTVVDLEEKVVEASRAFDDLTNARRWRDRVHVLVEDGRNHLLSAREPYDVITVDSTHPRSVDSWILYTSEFYELARSRLAPDGIIVEWVPMHGMSEEEFRILVGTFVDAFPEAQLWANVGYDRIGFTGYALLVGSPNGEIRIDADRIAGRMAPPDVREEMARFGLDSPAAVVDCFVAGPEALRRWTEDLPVNTDDRPITPFVTLHSHGPRMGPHVLGQVAERPGDLLAPPRDPAAAGRFAETLESLDEAEGFLLRGQVERALEEAPASAKIARYVEELSAGRSYYRRVAASFPDDGEVLLAAGTALQSLGDADGAAAILERTTTLLPRDARPWFFLGLAHQSAGRWDRAEKAFRVVIERDPSSVLGRINLGVTVTFLGDPYEATVLLDEAARIDPGFHRTFVHMGEAFLVRGEPQLALESFERATRLVPTDPLAEHGMGRALAALKRWDEASRAYQRAALLDPFWFAPHYDRGLALLAIPDFGGAEMELARAVEIDPSSAPALTDLGLAIAGQGRWAEAAEKHLAATEIDPGLARAWLNLGMALKALDEMEAAEAAFTRALVLDPGIAGL